MQQFFISAGTLALLLVSVATYAGGNLISRGRSDLQRYGSGNGGYSNDVGIPRNALGQDDRSASDLLQGEDVPLAHIDDHGINLEEIDEKRDMTEASSPATISTDLCKERECPESPKIFQGGCTQRSDGTADCSGFTGGK